MALILNLYETMELYVCWVIKSSPLHSKASIIFPFCKLIKLQVTEPL